jgi:hypothetical protein
MSSWWSDWWGSIESGFESGKKAGEKTGDKINEVTGLPDSSGAISALTDPLSFAKAIWLNVSDYRMWRSLGWVILGFILMVIGFLVWNRKAIGSAAKVAAL